MFHPMLARWLAVSSGLLALTVSAQTAAPGTPAASPGAAPASAPQGPGDYRSALEGYQPYGETKMVPWKAANDTVGQIGGWRAYAKEAAERQGQTGQAAPAVGAPKPAASQAKP